MSTSGFTLRLEYVAEGSGLEPVEFVREFSVDVYQVGDPALVQGIAIAGVEIITHPGGPPTYLLHRVQAHTTPQTDDPHATTRCVAVKMRWDDPTDPTQSITAYYASRVTEQVATSLANTPDHGTWLLVLKQAGGQNILIYQLDFGSRTRNSMSGSGECRN